MTSSFYKETEFYDEKVHDIFLTLCLSCDYLFNFLERNKRVSGVKKVTLTDVFGKFISFYGDFWLFAKKCLLIKCNPFLIYSLFQIQISLRLKVSLSFLLNGRKLICPKMEITDLRRWYWIRAGYWFFRIGGVSRYSGLTRLRSVYGHIVNPSVVWQANTGLEKSFVNKIQKVLFTDGATF